MAFYISAKKITLSVLFLSAFLLRAQQVEFQMRILKAGLADPWSVAVDGKNQLWITESKNYKVSRVDPQSKAFHTVLDLNSQREFPRNDTIKNAKEPWPQGGLMGLAIHPKFDEGQPYIYLAYVYKFTGNNRFLTRVSRFYYDGDADSLLREKVIDESIPGSNDHNGGRLAIMQDEETAYLFYAVGDMGAGQYANAKEINYAQDSCRKEGKILRYLLDPERLVEGKENWVPKENPFYGSDPSPVYSVGHRNPQGLTWGRSEGFSQLYSCEHGPFSDDEVNIILSGQNYGHPLIVGYADGNYNGLAAGASEELDLPGPWHTSLPTIEDEELSAHDLLGYQNPIYSFSATSNSYLRGKLQKLVLGEREDWKSVAPSSLAFYNSNAIPLWKNSLLITTLKAGAIYRLSLSADGKRVTGNPEKILVNKLRYRDIAISRDGRSIFVLTDRSSVTSGPTEDNPKELQLRGCLLEFRLQQ
ncbi:PQQ-dependent sugar dehydrogenase [Sphingobacterium bambusae]|uniref:PQQ-dependent sugar dehydrogenase n=1 Tax=Sphingobacterium bambusae TaxID=662858 RepID=A0ABW6B9W0_9SPHI|nr:PQQ-dependent sugar dehydrogenase [Sphingobacterium bambusae]WPL48489.1 PQQ-dependent sugar dehydrogenase [Sphingobacterium bambusae]